MFKYNPFKPGSIIHPGMFAGRMDELIILERSLFQTTNGNPEHFLIHGERGIGKSSLLLVVNCLARGEVDPIEGNEKYKFLTINIELEPNDDYREILQKIARELQREINKNEAIKSALKGIWNFITNWEVLGVRYNRESTPVDAMLEELSEKFAAIASSLREKGQGVFVFIDEADKAPAKAELGEFIKVLTERLAKRGSDNVGIGVVGISSVIKKLKESHESAVRILNPIELTTLLPEERKEVVQKGLGEAEEKNGITTSITDRALNFISDLSEGYPYFIQQYAYSAFEEDTDNNIDVRDVAVGLTKENGALQQLGIRHFENMYTEEVRSDDYRTVLQVIAQHSPNYVQRKTIIEESELRKHTVDNALTALKKRGSVIPKRGQKGQYKLPSRSFAVWINAYKITRHEMDQTEPNP
jgi:energy-coupling factor transporter ATP-binding protein EcfA2